MQDLPLQYFSKSIQGTNGSFMQLMERPKRLSENGQKSNSYKQYLTLMKRWTYTAKAGHCSN